MPEPPFAAILLAAGASTRLGRPKQLIEIDGESLLRRTARLAAEAGCVPVIVVLGSEADRMQHELAGLPVTVAENPSWAEGMGSSLRHGMATLMAAQPGPAGVLLLVCDQPRLTASHLGALLARHSHGKALITASGYAGRIGVPAAFSPECFAELLVAAGDRGARDLIRRNSGRVEIVPWSDGELDVDTVTDLERLARQ